MIRGHGTEPRRGDNVEAARRTLRRIWNQCFADAARETDAYARVEAQLKWAEERPRHLPATLTVMSDQLSGLRYGATGRTGQPVLLVMTGYSEEQIALVIAAHVRQGGCRRITPFVEKKVWASVKDKLAECLQHLDIDHTDVFMSGVMVEPNNATDVFRKITGWIRAHRDLCPAIDCTGGQKPMDAGAAHAASFYGLPAYYLDFTEYDPELRRPLPWTSNYREMTLPEPAFSLNRRRHVFGLYRARRFAAARVALTEIANGAQDFLDETDRKELTNACALLDQASSWMALRYGDRALANHPLHPLFGASSPAVSARSLVEKLLDASEFDLFFAYVVDESWRLKMSYEAGDSADHREVLIGCAGLAELVIDRMFREPWLANAHITGARVDETNPAEPLTNEGIRELSNWAGQSFPVSLIPHGALRDKCRLLREGHNKHVSFDLKVRVRNGRPQKILDYSGIRIVLDVKLTQPSPLADGQSPKALWNKLTESFPDSAWMQTRNDLVHLRTPLLSDQERGYVGQALEQHLPRFIEMLRRVHYGEPMDFAHASDESWLKWIHDPRWLRSTCAPWTEQHAEAQFEHWLRLKL